MMPRKSKRSSTWHTRENLEKWFASLTPERRLEIALEIEEFRKEAIVDDD